MSEYKASLNLLGCCVIRDIFGLHENDGGYQIKRYVQLPSPVSIVNKSPLLREIKIDDVVFLGQNSFVSRCQFLELNKQVEHYIAEDPADFFVVDVAEFRRKLLYFPETDGWLSENYRLKGMLDKYIMAGIVPGTYETYDPLELNESELTRYLTAYCEMLDRLYEREKIILVEVKTGRIPTGCEGDELAKAEAVTSRIFDKRMEYAYEFVKNRMAGVNVIEFPDNVILNYKHKWGRNLLHYENDYYDYALTAIDNIICGKVK
ncbi:DUF6270 domain-containing protein [Butyrivibrio sp. AC2005]|uniref:DUF6270 domain-containing protein n=1 Tax=Butyrivibrio sp. AC2005 TaxID=1280672 RepID=UPI0004219BBB|nr:DUF6270 domain-containing protein [Butyrivibrio sp. AC2005]